MSDHGFLRAGGWCHIAESTFYRLYNADEKARLYNAIGYEENEALSTFPIEVGQHVCSYDVVGVVE